MKIELLKQFRGKQFKRADAQREGKISFREWVLKKFFSNEESLKFNDFSRNSG